MSRTMPAIPDRQRLDVPRTRPASVDRASKVIHGVVVAQLGAFKSEGRGEFDQQSLDLLLSLWPANGLKSRFAHPTESSDGLGKHLGRMKSPRMSTVVLDRDGQQVTIPCVRADLHLSPTAFAGNPNGNLGEYVLHLAETDPEAFGTSLVLSVDKSLRRKDDGTPQLDADGRELPPLWRPKKLFASDVVDEGDSTDTFLGVEAAAESLHWTREYLAPACAALDKLFAGQPRRTVEARVRSFLTRYLDRRYGKMYLLGANLGGVLSGYIDDKAGGDENARVGVIAGMAEAAAISTDETISIVNGEADAPLPVLEAFSTYLECPLSELVTAAEADGQTFGGGEAPAEEEPAGEPPAGSEPPMPEGMSTAKRRRRLSLKTKGV